MARPNLRRTLEFRFYEELNDFLPASRRQRPFNYDFVGTPSIKDSIEAIGVPHTEVDLVLVNGESVDFGHRTIGGERVAVYPVFERFDITPLIRLRARPLRRSRFVADINLKKLARSLRLLGFDTDDRQNVDDRTIIEFAKRDHRIIVTRHRRLLRHSAITHGYWVRSTEPLLQLREVVRVFQLQNSLRPLSRCLRCNGELHSVDKWETRDELPAWVWSDFEELVRCDECRRSSGAHANTGDCNGSSKPSGLLRPQGL